MSSRTNNKSLWVFDDGDNINWHHYHNANIDMLEGEVLKLQNLNNVDIVYLRDKSILKWNDTSNRWQIVIERGYNT